jgi:GH24 family phage-related lysozyme (muramidase)
MNFIKSVKFTATQRICEGNWELVGFRTQPYKGAIGLWFAKSGNQGRTMGLYDTEEQALEAQAEFVERQYQQYMKAQYRKGLIE